MEFFTQIEGGKMQPNIVKQIQDYLPTLKKSRYCVSINKIKSVRSLQQNKYYWVLNKILSDELGYDKNELHAIIKFKFLTKEMVDENTGEIYNYVGETHKLNKSEFSGFIAELQRWAAEKFNCYLPSAGEQLNID